MIPDWALTAAYWLHMLATVVWIGGLVTLSLYVLPSARQVLAPSEYAVLLERIQKRIDPAAWFSLVLLLGTGMIQMSSNPNYEGFLVFDNRWAVALLIKHIIFVGMAVISAYMTWWVLPGMRRIVLQQAKGKIDSRADDEARSLYKREVYLSRLNLVLGVVILALTAMARTS